MSKYKIRDVRAIITHPPGARTLTVVKVETTEPELYGVGCASFCTRPTAVAAAVNDYLKPFLTGKNPSDIEDIWQSCYASSYWRSGPVLNNAISGVDQALWDIKGKVAEMPVYEPVRRQVQGGGGGVRDPARTRPRRVRRAHPRAP